MYTLAFQESISLLIVPLSLLDLLRVSFFVAACRLRWGRLSSLLFLANKLQRNTFLAWKQITPVLVAIRRRLRLAAAKRKQAITLWCSTVLRQWRYVACQRIMGRVLQRKYELAHVLPQVSACCNHLCLHLQHGLIRVLLLLKWAGQQNSCYLGRVALEADVQASCAQL